MTRITFALILLLLISSCYSQNWAPEGAKWHYGSSSAATGAFFQYYTYTSVGDTLINNKVCSILEKSDIPVVELCVPRSSKVEYMYEENGKVYFLNHLTNTFEKLYDFTKAAGESWTFRVRTGYPSSYNLDTFNVYVDSTSYVVINNDTLKILYGFITCLDSYWIGLSGLIIERFGHLTHMFPYADGACDLEWPSGLRCYEDSVFGFYQFDTTDCDYTNVGLNYLIDKFNIEIYYNHINHNVKVYCSTCKEFEVELFDLTGKLVFATNSNEFNIRTLRKGLYIIKVSNITNKFVVRKIIKYAH